ncbi:hypothetical protein EMIT091MI3_40063 [Kosakonia quasisacchari]
MGAELIYQSVSPEDEDLDNEAQQKTLRLVPGTTITSIRMLKPQHGPGIELFEMHGPEQREPLWINDFGLQHLRSIPRTSTLRGNALKRRAATFLPRRRYVFPPEKGAGNGFCY